MSIQWDRPKGLYEDSRTVKQELLSLLRIMNTLGIKAVKNTEYGFIFDDVRIIHP